jgi:hypothetical protein
MYSSSPDLDDEEELDPDCPYPAINQEINIDAGSEVLHLAIPSLNDLGSASDLLTSTALVAIASTDGAVSILRLPLTPPALGKEAVYLDRVGRTQTVVCSGGQISAGIALKIISVSPGEDAASAQVVVAVATQILAISRLTLTRQGLSAETETVAQKVPLSAAVRRISFHVSPRSSLLLLTDAAGCVHVYDPLASADSRGEPVLAETEKGSGRWLTTFHAPYPTNNSSSPNHLNTLRRKKLLDARFVLGGKRVLALLSDGEWGMWDLSGAASDSRSFGGFVLRGFLSTSSTGDASSTASKPRAGISRLAPTTPNTRKAKAESLFSGAPKAASATPQGGISVSISPGRGTSADESVVMWYGNEVYAIPSVASFCQRSTSNEGSFGSLYGPGLAHIPEINIRNENISAISQFAASESGAHLGQMNVTRDLFIAAEYQAIVLHTVKPAAPARNLFQAVATERSPLQDQRMLDAGELDLGGMDRLLDGMANRPRKVGFAAEHA